jgi:hypothetical protein
MSVGSSSGVVLIAGFWPGTVGAAFDQDRDLAPNVTDNCTVLPNATQLDADRDGYGNACDGDLTNDGVVNAADLARLKSVFFRQDPVADLNGDGVVNAVDLAMLKRSFFRKPGPSAKAP